jgi:hypothetical protein
MAAASKSYRTKKAKVRTAAIDGRLYAVIVIGGDDDTKSVQAAIPDALERRDRLGVEWTPETLFREGLLQQAQSGVRPAALAALMNDSQLVLPGVKYPITPERARSIVRAWERSSRRKHLASFMPKSIVGMQWQGPVDTVQITSD